MHQSAREQAPTALTAIGGRVPYLVSRGSAANPHGHWDRGGWSTVGQLAVGGRGVLQRLVEKLPLILVECSDPLP